MKARIALGAMIAVLIAVPWLASAKHADLVDGADTKGLLDIQRVRVHGDERPTWKVITFARWGSERVFDRGYALVNIDARGDEHFEYYALVRSVGGRMGAELFRNRKSKPDFSLGGLNVWRNDRKSVAVRIPLRRLRVGDDRIFFRWFVQTLMTGSECQRVCIDRAPDEGSVEQLLGGPSPTPTVTIDPSPSASPSVDPPSTSPTPTASPSP